MAPEAIFYISSPKWVRCYYYHHSWVRENGTKIEELVGWESFRMSKNSKNMCIQKGFVNTQNHCFKVLMVAS